MSSPFIQCPKCPCVFITEHDLNLHKRVCGVETAEWHKSNWDDSEWCYAEKMPKLASAVRTNGKLTMGGFDITLNGKYLKKHIARM